jgi:hypothetical protein
MLDGTDINIRKAGKRTCRKHAENHIITPLANEIAGKANACIRSD